MREHVVLRERVGEPPGTGRRGGDRGDQNEGPRQPDEDAEGVDDAVRERAAEGLRDPDQRLLQPAPAEVACVTAGPVRVGVAGKRRDPHDRDHDRDGHRGADAEEEPAWERLARLAGLGRQVGDGLEAGVGEHGDRERERDRAPGRGDAEVDACAEAAARGQDREAEDGEQHVAGEGDPRRGRHQPAQQLPLSEQPDGRHGGDEGDSDHDVPGAGRRRVPAERMPEVVRREEPGERDHDQVVEEERPADQEPGGVVEPAPHERRRAAHLRDGRRSLRVRDRDDEEERADGEQHPRGQPERVQRDDPEGEVERGRHLAVRDRRQGGGPEDAAESFDPRGHRLATRKIEPETADREEQTPEDEAEPAADAELDRARDQRRPDGDEEHRGGGPTPHAAFLPAAMRTRHGAFFST